MATMPSIIDADVHLDVPYLEALHPYLSDHWIEHFTQSLDRGASPPKPPAPGAPKLTRNTSHAPPVRAAAACSGCGTRCWPLTACKRP